MNEYIEFLGILDGIKTCLKIEFSVANALEMVETAEELYNMKINDFNESEGQ